MKTHSRFLFAASLVLALALTFGCSDNSGGPINDNGQGGNQNIPSVNTCPNAVTGNGTMSCGGQTYKTVSINDQVWMAENMNYNATGSKCLDNLTSKCTTYGRLYNWATAMVVCPVGWHLPNKADWEKLFRYVDSQNGGNGTGNLYNNSYISLLGKYLKTKEGWEDCGPFGSGKDFLCEDAFGFSALPGGGAGYTFPDIYSFTQIDVGYWWSSEGNNNEAYYLHMFSYDGAGYESNPSTYLKSVRCLKDGSSIGGTLPSSSSLPQSSPSLGSSSSSSGGNSFSSSGSSSSFSIVCGVSSSSIIYESSGVLFVNGDIRGSSGAYICYYDGYLPEPDDDGYILDWDGTKELCGDKISTWIEFYIISCDGSNKYPLTTDNTSCRATGTPGEVRCYGGVTVNTANGKVWVRNDTIYGLASGTWYLYAKVKEGAMIPPYPEDVKIATFTFEYWEE